MREIEKIASEFKKKIEELEFTVNQRKCESHHEWIYYAILPEKGKNKPDEAITLLIKSEDEIWLYWSPTKGGINKWKNVFGTSEIQEFIKDLLEKGWKLYEAEGQPVSYIKDEVINERAENPDVFIRGDQKPPRVLGIKINSLEEIEKYLTIDKEKYKKMLEKFREEFSKSQHYIKNILNAIETKPFIILAGVSGTGKTQLARLIAAIWTKKEDENDKNQNTKG